MYVLSTIRILQLWKDGYLRVRTTEPYCRHLGCIPDYNNCNNNNVTTTTIVNQPQPPHVTIVMTTTTQYNNMETLTANDTNSLRTIHLMSDLDACHHGRCAFSHHTFLQLQHLKMQPGLSHSESYLTVGCFCSTLDC